MQAAKVEPKSVRLSVARVRYEPNRFRLYFEAMQARSPHHKIGTVKNGSDGKGHINGLRGLRRAALGGDSVLAGKRPIRSARCAGHAFGRHWQSRSGLQKGTTDVHADRRGQALLAWRLVQNGRVRRSAFRLTGRGFRFRWPLD